MSHIKKYYLIDPLRYDQLRSIDKNKSSNSSESLFKHPNLKKAEELNADMKSVLNDTNLTEFEKMEQYSGKLQTFLQNFKSALNTPKLEALLGKRTIGVTSDSARVIDEKNEEPSFLSKQESLLSSIPASYQSRAKHLLNFIQTNNKFHFTENGKVKYHDTIIPTSDFTSILHDVVRSRKPKTDATSVQNFIEFLSKEGYPVSRLSKAKPSSKVSIKKLKRTSFSQPFKSSKIPRMSKDFNKKIISKWETKF